MSFTLYNTWCSYHFPHQSNKNILHNEKETPINVKMKFPSNTHKSLQKHNTASNKNLRFLLHQTHTHINPLGFVSQPSKSSHPKQQQKHPQFGGSVHNKPITHCMTNTKTCTILKFTTSPNIRQPNHPVTHDPEHTMRDSTQSITQTTLTQTHNEKFNTSKHDPHNKGHYLSKT